MLVAALLDLLERALELKEPLLRLSSALRRHLDAFSSRGRDVTGITLSEEKLDFALLNIE